MGFRATIAARQDSEAMMSIKRKLFGVIIALNAIFVGPVNASDGPLDAVLARLDKLEKENSALRERVRNLEAPDKTPLSRTARAANPTALVAIVPPLGANPNNARATATFADAVTTRSQSPFRGPYIGVLGGLDFYTGQNAPIQTWTPAPIEGGLLGVFGGYNETLGSIVVGTEVRLNRGFGQIETDTPSPPDYFNFNSHSLPVFLQSGCCDSPSLHPLSSPSDPYVLAPSSYTSTKIMKTYGGDVSARTGFVAFDEWLLYARLAAGAQLFDASRTTSTTDTLCGSPIVTRTITPNHTYTDYLTSCGRTSTTTTAFTQSETSVTPYLSVGFGIEKNVENFFGRGEVEIIDYLGSFNGTLMQYTPFYQLRLTGGVGYRFQ